MVRRIAVIFFLLVFFGMIWPVYPLFNRIEPMILGMPFSLFYLILLLALSFLVLLFLFFFEEHQGRSDS